MEGKEGKERKRKRNMRGGGDEDRREKEGRRNKVLEQPTCTSADGTQSHTFPSASQVPTPSAIHLPSVYPKASLAYVQSAFGTCTTVL